MNKLLSEDVCGGSYKVLFSFSIKTHWLIDFGCCFLERGCSSNACSWCRSRTYKRFRRRFRVQLFGNTWSFRKVCHLDGREILFRDIQSLQHEVGDEAFDYYADLETVRITSGLCPDLLGAMTFSNYFLQSHASLPKQIPSDEDYIE